jgi:hypothetical protein
MEYATGRQNTPDEAAYQAYVRSAWAAFAKDPANALSNAPFNWPKYSNETTSVIKLANHNQAPPAYADTIAEYGLCPFVHCATELIAPPERGLLTAAAATLVGKKNKPWAVDETLVAGAKQIPSLVLKHGKKLHQQMSKCVSFIYPVSSSLLLLSLLSS